MIFLSDKPDVKVECGFFWCTHYEILSQLPDMPSFPEELSKFKLLGRAVIADASEAPAFQKARVVDMLTSKLQKTIGTSDLLKCLRVRIAPFLKQDAQNYIDQALAGPHFDP